MKTTTNLFIKFLSLTWFMAVLGSIHAQSVPQQIIATDGGFTETETISMSWTIGDISINTMSNTSLITTQGFQQSFPLASFPDQSMIFSGEVLPEANTLKWAISSAINNDHFTLMRSTDGITFTEVTRINGLGSSADPQDYEFLDKEAPVGRVYYRLKQVGLDGQTISSKMISLDRLAIFNSQGFKMQAYPNPADNDITVNFDSDLKEDLQLQVFDCWGGLLQTHFVPEGQSELALSLADLPSGIYFFSLRRASSHQIISTSRIIKSGL